MARTIQDEASGTPTYAAVALAADAKLPLLAAIVDSSDDAIVGQTLDGIVTSWNRGAEPIYGYAADEVLGEPFFMLVAAERADELDVILDRIRRSEQVEHYEAVRILERRGARHLEGRGRQEPTDDRCRDSLWADHERAGHQVPRARVSCRQGR